MNDPSAIPILVALLGAFAFAFALYGFDTADRVISHLARTPPTLSMTVSDP
jgi:hypothetical protein